MPEPLSLLIPEQTTPSSVNNFARSKFGSGVNLVPARTGDSFIGYDANHAQVEVRLIPTLGTTDTIRALNDMFHTSWPTAQVLARMGGGFLTPAMVAEDRKTFASSDRIARAYQYPLGVNYLDLLLQGELTDNWVAIDLMTNFIANTEQKTLSINLESASQLLDRRSLSDYNGVFYENVADWQNKSNQKLASLQDEALRSNLTRTVNDLARGAGEFRAELVGIGGMHGDPNFSRYLLTPENELVVSRFEKHTSRYIKGYGIASTLSYIIVQLANVEGIDAPSLAEEFLQSYAQRLGPERARNYFATIMPVINQRLLGDLFGVITAPTTQEKFSVQPDRVYDSLQRSRAILDKTVR
jgi:hypothetical protein